MEHIILNKLDYARIKKRISTAKQFKTINQRESEKLLTELSSAKVVEPEKIPSNVVTMNSIVKLSFINKRKQVQFQIVYPENANVKENKISIFSPVGTALIGYKVNDEIEWQMPSGVARLRIDELVYQPESSGDYNL